MKKRKRRTTRKPPAISRLPSEKRFEQMTELEIHEEARRMLEDIRPRSREEYELLGLLIGMTSERITELTTEDTLRRYGEQQ